MKEQQLANHGTSHGRSKDEFDVARTLAKFSTTAINFDSDRQSSSSEREKTLTKLSHDRRSVICENPGSVHTNQSHDADMDTDDDIDIDVEALDEIGIDDPLADVEGVYEDSLMDTDQPETYRIQEDRKVN